MAQEEIIEVGDMVERFQGGENGGWNEGDHFKVIKIFRNDILSTETDGTGTVTHDKKNIKLIKKANQTNTMAKTLAEKIKLAGKSEPEKTFIKAGILNMDGSFTTEGQSAFLNYLLEKNGAAFKTDVVDGLMAEIEAEQK